MRWGVVAAAYYGGIFWLSSAPRPLGVDVPNFDKLIHALVFGGLAFCVVKAVQEARPAMAAKHVAIIAVGVTAALGASDELHQAFVPMREASVFDLAADVAGAMTAAFLALRRSL